MSGRSQEPGTPTLASRPQLELSGPILRRAFEALAEGAENQGGVERYVDALKLKSKLFKDTLLGADGSTADISPAQFAPLCAFMPTVRRRVGTWLEEPAFGAMSDAISELLQPTSDTAGTDQRLRRFGEAFPNDGKHRWVRDLGAELLHNVDPERFPLMTRWVWDAETNTGVLREIWFGDDVDHRRIPAHDDYDTFLMLREELSQFLSDNGVFRDVMHFVDMLCAQVYANYICEQGGSYLRADFSAPEDPMQHTRRLLGLDGVRPRTGSRHSETIDGQAAHQDLLSPSSRD